MNHDCRDYIRLLVFGLFALAGVTLVLSLLLKGVDQLPFFALILLLPILLLFGIWTVLNTSQLLAMAAAVSVLCLIDFGIAGFYTGIVLGLKGIVYGLCLLVGAQFLVRNPGRLGPVEWALVLYVSFAWVSAVYSVEAWTSTYTGFGLAALGLVSIRMAFEPTIRLDRYITLSGRALAVFLVASIVLYLVFPAIAVATQVAGEGRVSGLFGSPNSAGGVSGLALVLNMAILLWPGATRFSRPLAAAAVLVAAAALYLSGSRNGMISAAAAVFVMFCIRWPRLVLPTIMGGSVMVLLLTLFDGWAIVFDFVISLISRQRYGFDVQNLTGRTEIWAFVIEKWQRAPVLGYGLGGARTVISEGWASFWGKTTGTSHNALLESLLDLGLIGTALLLGYIVLVAVGALRRATIGPGNEPSANAALGILVFVLMFGVAEKSFAGTPSTATGGLLIAGALVGFCMRRKKTITGQTDLRPTSDASSGTSPVARPGPRHG